MIFYFSATGNCKNVANIIAEQTGDRAVAIADALRGAAANGTPGGGASNATGEPTSGAGGTAFKEGAAGDAMAFSYDLAAGESVGFVTPTYFWGLPRPTADFVRRLRLTREGAKLDAADTYAYCVSTYGTTPGQSGRMLGDLLDEHVGLKLSARFSVKMTDTWTPIFDLSDAEKNRQVIEVAQEEARGVAHRIAAREQGDFCPRLRPPLFAARLEGVSYGPASDTSKFSVTDACIGCGLCARKCPVGAIEVRGGRPVWAKAHCAVCLGCLHRCPKHAIDYGRGCERKRTRKHAQFTNPYARV